MRASRQDAPTSDQATINKNADGSINIPQDGSQYIPQAGDVIRCDAGTNYTITDVRRYDKNYFADGPVGSLSTATCDWSQFDQPELPKAEVAANLKVFRAVDSRFCRSEIAASSTPLKLVGCR